MTEPVIASHKPFAVDIEAGKEYWWCACGLSRTQPFCDGSHKGTGFSPIPFRPEKSEKVWFCGCKHSGHKPMCDGTHKTLPAG